MKSLLLVFLLSIFCFKSFAQTNFEKTITINDPAVKTDPFSSNVQFKITSSPLGGNAFQICVTLLKSDGTINANPACDFVGNLSDPQMIARIIVLFTKCVTGTPILADNATFINDHTSELETLLVNINLTPTISNVGPSIKAIVLSTNINLPIIRFNRYTDQHTNNAVGTVNFFSSAGAGVSLNFGRYSEFKNDSESQKQVEGKFINIIGLQLGFLFSSNNSNGTTTNTFAPFLALSVLDFQIGWGYELGTLSAGNKNGFWVLSYGIPLQKITDLGTLVVAKLKYKKKKGSEIIPQKRPQALFVN